MHDASIVDWVPIVGITATAAVGVAGNVTQYRLARGSQQHERQLAREARGADDWRELRDMLVAIASWCLDTRRWLERPTSRIGSRGQEVDSQLLAHGSDVLRIAVEAFDEALIAIWRAPEIDIYSLDAVRESKLAAVDAGTFDIAAEARAEEIRLLEPIRTRIEPLRPLLASVERALSPTDRRG